MNKSLRKCPCGKMCRGPRGVAYVRVVRCAECRCRAKREQVRLAVARLREIIRKGG